MTLNPKQQAFVEAYLVTLSAKEAAERAGYSSHTAKQIGSRLLSHPEVAAAIAEGQKARSQRTEITADAVLRELARIGFSDVRRIFTPSGALLSPADMDEDTAACIASVDVVERVRRNESGETEIEQVKKIRLNDKLGALTQLGRHLGLFTDKLDVNVSDELAQRLDKARRRVAEGRSNA